MSNEQEQGNAQAFEERVPADGLNAGNHANAASEEHVPANGLSDASNHPNAIPAGDAPNPQEMVRQSLESAERKHNRVAIELALSIAEDTSSARGPASAATRRLRTEAQTLRENIAALRDVLQHYSPAAQSNQQRSVPTSCSSSGGQSPEQPRFDRPISLPSGLPRFQRLGASTQSAHDFLTAFEDRLRAHNYPEHRYPDALLTCCNKEEADWCRVELRDLTWAVAKSKFLAHFARANMTEFHREQFETISQRPRESLLVFADRYLQAMRMAGYSPTSPDRTTHFVLRLPLDVQRQLNCLQLTNPNTVESVTAIINTLSVIYRESSTAPSPNAVRPPSSWCPRHQTSAHDASTCQGSSKETGKRKQWCEFHKSGGHDTKDCRAWAAATARPAGGGETNSRSSALTVTSAPRCYRCNKSGHYANRCPAFPATLAASRTTNHHIGFQDADYPPAGASASVVDALDMLHPVHTSLHLVHTQQEPNNGPITVPVVLLPNIHLNAYLDTGASHSIVKQSMLESLPAEVRATFEAAAENSVVSLGAKDVVTPRIGSVAIPFLWNGCQITHRFEVLDPPAGVDIMIRRDLLKPLGIGLTGLPLPSSSPSTPPPEDVGEPLVDAGVDNEHVHHPRLVAALGRNQAIPRNSFCHLPESTVLLDTGAAAPVYRRQYGVAHSLEPIIDDQIKQWFEDGKIAYAPRGCQWNHPLLVVPKKTADGSKAPGRVCIDPRGLNRLLVAEKYPAPRVRDVFEAMTGKAWFSSLDLEQSFLQLRIHPDHQQKVAFSWRGMHYMFVGTPFGLTPTSAVLQRVVNAVFHQSPRVKPFQDDVTVGSDDILQHLDDVVAAINALTAANLRLRVAKCQFFKRSLNILGHVLSVDGVQIDKRKLVVIPASRPQTGKDVERYLGLANYFRDFVPEYASLAAPLEKLRHRSAISEQEWRGDPESAYKSINNILSAAPMLTLPDFDKEFCVAVDASATGLGAVLYQLRDPGIEDMTSNRLWIVFAARSLHAAERNYSATKRELLAIVFALRRFHYYI